jgi:hypothetical protein
MTILPRLISSFKPIKGMDAKDTNQPLDLPIAKVLPVWSWTTSKRDPFSSSSSRSPSKVGACREKKPSIHASSLGASIE